MEFKKIQLNGFKSFADKTNFLIEEGLTGIVGPNGCGKSNIVESLRWVMGETSAKSMRGSGMEDVIFSGTSNKTSKNIAEVSIEVENKNNEGPVQYRELEEISVRRKIEKDKGSKFYINDKEVRARDAQMFFADLSTGAHSPSMISQGRIGALVTAKPTDRRAILEEANKNLQKFLVNEGFNVDFEKCIKNEEIEDFVLNDRIDGVKKYKVNATPTIIINDEKFEKSLNYKNLKKALEKLI